MRYQVFYNAITRPAWVLVDTWHRNAWGNYWVEGSFPTEAEAQALAAAWNADATSAPMCPTP